jgi:hypothetical protein
MASYNVYAGEAVHGTRRFRPKGKIHVHHVGAIENPSKRLGGVGYSARLFVGLNVGTRRGFTEKDVIAAVWRIRKRQKKSADASILSQKGIYEDFRGRRIIEPSVQVIIIDTAGTPKREFVDEMKELAEGLRARLKQETVILEIQRKGVSTDIYSVTR